MPLISPYSAEEILLAIACLLFIVQALYYLCLYNRILRHDKAARRKTLSFAEQPQPLSVVIYAPNRLFELQQNLRLILDQDYPEFEVIVVNNGNTDDSEDFLTRLEDEYHNLYHSFVPQSSRYISRKKLAITLGIRAAKYDWIVLTEPECAPQSNQWLRLMARNFTPRAGVVLGYSGYMSGKGWAHLRVSFDNLFLSMRYLGYALAGSPYMGIGRNLAYRKDLFFRKKGFSAHLNLIRGDDDLFVNNVATPDNTRVETDARAAMRMPMPAHMKVWREEKIGYASTARMYSGMQRYMLGAETTTRLLFHAAWIATAVVSAMQSQWVLTAVAALLMVLRFLVQVWIVNHTARVVGDDRRYFLSLPVFDVLRPLQTLGWKLGYLLRKKSEFLRK